MNTAACSGPDGLSFDPYPPAPGYINAYSPAASTKSSVRPCCISVPLIFKMDDSAPGWPPFSRSDKQSQLCHF